MAKKRKNQPLIKTNRKESNVVSIDLSSDDNLPLYTHFSDSRDGKFRLFFEQAKNDIELISQDYPNISISRAVNKGSVVPFRIAENIFIESGNLSPNLARSFARMFIKLLKEKTTSKSTLGNIHSSLSSFFQYLSDEKVQAEKLTDLTQKHFSEWMFKIGAKKAEKYRLHLNTLLKFYPYFASLNLNEIRLSTSSESSKSINEAELLDERDYDDKVLIQILAYVFYEIDLFYDRLKTFEEISKDSLGDDFIAINDLSIKNKVLVDRLESDSTMPNVIRLNIIYYVKQSLKGNLEGESITPLAKFLAKLRLLCSRKHFKDLDLMNKLMQRMEDEIWITSKPTKHKTTKNARKLNFTNFYSGISMHGFGSILLYVLITTGVNLGVALTWKRHINGKHWSENFDTELGIDLNTPASQKSVLLVGKKIKGANVKHIFTSISVNSPIYKHLTRLDDALPHDNEYFFSGSMIYDFLSAFPKKYPILDTDNKRLKTLETSRFRKVFAGHKLLSVLNDVDDSDELIYKLQHALNHKKFDTTFFSYLLKSGVANTTMNAAIVSLTSDLLEKSLQFKGQIRTSSQRNPDAKKVFLCDCNDNTNPSHGLPIAERCTRYDMCLGCERSEVFAEHIPRICYRILQYEEARAKNSEEFKDILEDRYQIALSAIEKFSVNHTSGEEIVEAAYLNANEAFALGEQLLPPILQTGEV